MKLDIETASRISSLINSLTIQILCVERNDRTPEQTTQHMEWHDQYANELEKFGIDVAKYNHNPKI